MTPAPARRQGGDRESADGRDLSVVAGVIPRAIHQIFGHLESISSDCTVKCSFLELYNEELTDLLFVGVLRASRFPALRQPLELWRKHLPCRRLQGLHFCTAGHTAWPKNAGEAWGAQAGCVQPEQHP